MKHYTTKIQPGKPKLNPKQVELLVDFAKLTRKWTPPKLADAFGINRHAIDYHLNKEKHE